MVEIRDISWIRENMHIYLYTAGHGWRIFFLTQIAIHYEADFLRMPGKLDMFLYLWRKNICHKVSNIRRTESQTLNAFRLIL